MRSIRYRLMKIFWQMHLKLYLLSSGRMVNTIRGLPVLLLTTTGIKTGLPRTKALMFLPYGKDFAVIASNLGENKHPAWWSNLKAEPTAMVQIGKEQFTVRAREVEGYERDKLWRAIAEINSDYERYRQRTSRRLPVVVLERQ